RRFWLDTRHHGVNHMHTTSPPQTPQSGRRLSPEFLRDVSRGSMTGFGAGLVVCFFSRVIAMLAGATILTLHVS
ncbi:hypothetical protein SODALDRAFT_251926, partial [Sodiomyces alkalinus F11]